MFPYEELDQIPPDDLRWEMIAERYRLAKAPVEVSIRRLALVRA